MKKICFIIDSLNGGGAERIVLNLANELTLRNNNVHIIILRNEIDYIIDNDSINLHILSENGKVSKISFLNKYILAKLLKQKVKEIESNSKRFDLFVSNLEESDKVSKLAKLDNLYHAYHGVMSKFVESKYKNKKGLKRIYRKLKYFILMKLQYDGTNILGAQGVLDDLVTYGIKPKSLTTIYNPFDFDLIRDKANEYLVDEKDYIICVARFAKAKRHDLLIKAYYEANIDQKLLLLGTTDKQAEILNVINNGSSIRDYIHIDDVVNIYQNILEIESPTILNIASGNGVSLKNILDILKINNINLKVSSLLRDEIKISTACTNQLKDIIDLSEFIQVEEYLLKTLKIF